uniref:Coatomer subunit beta n=1 Tax=Piliocolobus tephrosceles TaxID=591936 RepID=A0A8C9LTX3_9PRIM
MGSLEIENNCTLYICTDHYEVPPLNEIQKKLESQNVEKKIEGMENLIFNIIQGEPNGHLLMSVIRFIVPHKDHRLKKMTHIFFEIVDKCNNDGTLKEEMILVCNALRNDIISPNEYVRGSTLRLLSKIKYLKVLDPLIEAITKNLNHRHSYVRKNAISCIHTIIKEHGIDVIPNAVKEVEKILFIENDISTKRCALSMLIDIDPYITLMYILSLNEQLYDTADVILLEVIHLFKKLYIPHVFDDSYLIINDNHDDDNDDGDNNEENSSVYDSDSDNNNIESNFLTRGINYNKSTNNNNNNNQWNNDSYNSSNNLVSNLMKEKNERNKQMFGDIHNNMNILDEDSNTNFEQNNNIESHRTSNKDTIVIKKKTSPKPDYEQYKNEVINILLNMLKKNVSNSVSYEGACCLLYMSTSILSIKTASECFIKLLINQHDNNIKLIVIDKLYFIMCKWKNVLEHFTMDLLRALYFPSKDIKIKILNLVLHVLTKRNVHLVLNVLKKELLKLNDQIVATQNMKKVHKGVVGGGVSRNDVGINMTTNMSNNTSTNMSNNNTNINNNSTNNNSNINNGDVIGGTSDDNYGKEKKSSYNYNSTNNSYKLTSTTTNRNETIYYKKLLIKALQHICSIYPYECIKTGIVDLLLIYINDEQNDISYEAAVCIRTLTFNEMNENNIIEKIIDSLFNCKKNNILRIFFWVLGQCMHDNNTIFEFLNKIYENLYGIFNTNIELSIINKIQNEKFQKRIVMDYNLNASPSNIHTKTVILEDGTYATEAFIKTHTNSDTILNKNNYNNNNTFHSFGYDILCTNDDLLLSVLCVCITKLYLKLLLSK